ncbi:MAG: VWA domain-containing protein [Pseudomonadota bacterium]
MAFHRFLSASLVSLCAATGAAVAQDAAPDTILVLDASGSMWGQIDGINKIVIAREVIANVMQDLPPSLELGLMAYGHNRRGDCSDIEMLIAPGPDTRGAIVDAVNAINPRGRTPMSDAVVAAAEAMRHTENEATVILVSDGIETCDADPCAVAASLETAGIGFTAHVIGFDVASEPAARAQMQCLAENTGGVFLTADTAEELAAALTQVAAAAPPPAPANVTVTAVLAPNGAPPVSPLSWTLSSNGVALLGPVAAPGFVVELPAGDYVVDVLRENQGTNHATAFSIRAGETREVVLELPALLTPVTFEARLDTVDGPLIEDPVLWSVGEISDTAGNPFATDLEAGAYSVEAYWTAAEQSQTSQIALLGSDPRTVVLVFETPLPSASLIAPETGVAGDTIEVAWQGPNANGDFIAAGDLGEDTYRTWETTAGGSPALLRLPSQPGMYELRYILADGRDVLARQTITVTPAVATLEAPETAIAGETIGVTWQGPDYAPDYIAVSEPGSTTHVNMTLTRNGSPLDLVMPVDPGQYELRYVMQQDREVIASRRIDVVAVSATLEAPETAIAGDTIPVTWTGPDYANDFISVAEPDDPRGYVNLRYTRDGAELGLVMPTEPGLYEIRYVLSQDRQVIAARMIEVTDVGASLDAPETAISGSTIDVVWSGPDYANDFISVANPDDPRGYVNYRYTRDGTPAAVQMPTDPGMYELRYVLNQDREIIATRRIEVTAVGASLSVPATAPAGSEIEITWTGPDYQNDFISVAEPEDDRGYINYTYTREGAPLMLRLPSTPGTYEVRYVVNQDRSIIASQEITVTPVTASLIVPAEAPAGATIDIEWTGPDYQNDFISVARLDDARGYVNYRYTREGSPAALLMPATPGTYEVRYVINSDRTTIAVGRITVTELPDVQFDAPRVATAGGTITMRHDGPDYGNDFVAFGLMGDDSGYDTYAYTRTGNPLTLRVPDTPGTYELRYYMRQSNQILGRQEITVE